MPKLPPKDYVDRVAFPQVVELQPIGVVHSPYKERHGTPRQSQLRSAPPDYQPALAQVELFAHRVPAVALRDLEGFDRLWLITWLHLNRHWNPTVKLPRGNTKISRGTLATRAPHRPNPIGLSATRLVAVEGLWLTVEGIDLLDQTPVLDLKPYVTYCDAFPEARCGYVDTLETEGIHEEDIFGQGFDPEKRPRLDLNQRPIA
jgi:tRNA (adenine37-N6)-methyltransferase